MDKEDLKYIEAGILGCSESELTEDLIEEDFNSFKQSLEFPLEVYRGLSVNSKESIDLKNVGKSWTTNPNLFLSSDTTLGDYIPASNCNYILTGYVDEDDVDWEQTEIAFNTFSNDYWQSEDEFDYDCECEITLRDGVTPKNIKIETREEFYGDELEEQLKPKIKEDLSQEVDSEGNPLTPEQVEFFKNSKVRDSQGRLLVCYHGSDADRFDTFDHNFIGDDNKSGYGFYFTLGTKLKFKHTSEYACYINLTNPLTDMETIGRYVRDGEDLRSKGFTQKEIIDKLSKKYKCDGIINQERGVIAFNSNQIKSITNKTPSNSNNINEDWLSDANKKETIRQELNQAYDDLMGNDKTRLYRYREWANNSNNDYKEYIYNDLLNGKKEDALHYWYNHYKSFTGNYDLSYDDFLNTPITLYRATNVNEKDDTTNPFFSYAQSKKLAQRFLDTTQGLYNNRTGEIEEISIKPKDTLGMIPSDEDEIIVPNKAYQSRVNDMSSIVDNVIKYANENNVRLPYDRDYILTLFNKRDKENVEKLEAHLMNYIDKRKGNKIKESAYGIHNNYSVKVYRVGKDEQEYQNTTRFYTDNLDYFKYSDTGYSRNDAKPFLLNLTDFKVWNPIKELELDATTWGNIAGRIEDFEKYGIGYYDYDDVDDDYEFGYTDTDYLADAGRELGYDITILEDIPSDHGYGPEFTEYAVHNSNAVKSLNATKFDKNSANINEDLKDKTFTFPNLRQAIDFFWKDRNAKIETVPIKQLVDDNDLLNDWDLQSYHQRQWDNKKASEFSIDKGKVNSMRISEVPYVVRKKDGKLELGDGRHRTRALYNDGYEYVTLPVITESISKTTPRIRESLLQEGKQDKENFKKWIENNDGSPARYMSSGNKEAYVNNWVTWFDSIRQNLKSPYNDFYYWIKLNDWNAFTKFMQEQRNKEDAKQREKNGARLIYSDKDWKVYEITTYEASVKYGANTKWCISGSKRWSNGENGKGYWDGYTSKGVKFYFFIGKDTKYALAIYPNGTDFEIFDAQDISIAYIPNAPIIDEIKVDYYSHNEDRLLLNLIKTGQLPRVCDLLSDYLIDQGIDIFPKSEISLFLNVVEEYINPDWVLWMAVDEGEVTKEQFEEETGKEYREDYFDGDTTMYYQSDLGFLNGHSRLEDALTIDNPYFEYDTTEYYISDIGVGDIDMCKDWTAVWLYIKLYLKDEAGLAEFAKEWARDNNMVDEYQKLGLSKEYLLDVDESLDEHLESNVDLKENTTDNIKLIAYHSSPKKFNKFNLSNFDTGQGDGGMYGKGHYFTNSVDLAKSWNENGYLYKVELTFKHPYICKTNGDRDELSKLINSKLVNGKNTNDLTNLFNQGYDSIISYDEDWETDNGIKYFDQYVEFKDNQIKILDIEKYDTNINEDYANNLYESLEDFDDEVGVVYHGGIEKSLHKDFRSILWFTEDYDYALDFGENIFICNLNLKNTFIVGNTDGYVRGLIPTQFSTDFTRLANNLKVTPKELLKCNPEAKNIYSIVRTKAFKELCIKNGYDSVETEEFGHVCFGVFNLDQVDIVDTDFEDEGTLETLSPMDESLTPNLREELLLEKGTDYKKQAIKIISNSGLFDEETSTKIIDGLFRQDIHAFNHAPAWLEKYLKGIARMLVEYCDGDRSKAQSFLTEGVSILNEYLEWVKQNREKIGNQLDDEFNNNLHYQDVKNKVEEIEKQRDEQSKQELSKMKFNSKSNYTLVPINSFDEFNSKYGGRVTGDGSSDAYAGGGGTAWCHANSESTYDNWTTGGRKFFVLQRNDWKEIPFNKESNEKLDGKDDYGNSLIAISTNK